MSRWIWLLLVAGCSSAPVGESQMALGSCVLPNWTAPGCFDFQSACPAGMQCETPVRHLCPLSDGTVWESDAFAPGIAFHFTVVPEGEYGWKDFAPCYVLCETAEGKVISQGWAARPSCERDGG